MKCELKVEFDIPSQEWIILAQPGTERGIDGAVLWQGKEKPSRDTQRYIWNAVNYGVRLAVRGASIYVDSLIREDGAAGQSPGSEVGNG